MKLIRIIEEPIYEFPCFVVSPGGRGVAYETIYLTNIIADRLPAGLDTIIVASDLQAKDRPGEDGRLVGLAICEELKLLSDCRILPWSERIGVMLAGDFFCDPDLRKRGGAGDVQEVWEAFGHGFGWVVGVAGNHDRFDGKHEIPDNRNPAFQKSRVSSTQMDRPDASGNWSVLDGGMCERNGMSVGGISGIIGNPRKRWRRPEEAFVRMIGELAEKSADILILHEGPSVPEIGAKGHEAIRAALDAVRNDMIVISGHTHWSQVFCRISEHVQAINVDFRVVIISETELDKI